jgi:bifunctional non-homologous end joining protein LigD
VPLGRQWLHEIAVDGRRVFVCLEKGRARVLDARDGSDVTREAPEVARALPSLDAREALLEGTIALVADEPSEDDLPAARKRKAKADRVAVLFAWDLLALDGVNLRRRPLEARKAALKHLFIGAPPALRWHEHVVGSGPEVEARARAAGAAAIVSRRRDGAYPDANAGDAWSVTALPRTAQAARRERATTTSKPAQAKAKPKATREGSSAKRTKRPARTARRK